MRVLHYNNLQNSCLQDWPRRKDYQSYGVRFGVKQQRFEMYCSYTLMRHGSIVRGRMIIVPECVGKLISQRFPLGTEKMNTSFNAI